MVSFKRGEGSAPKRGRFHFRGESSRASHYVDDDIDPNMDMDDEWAFHDYLRKQAEGNEDDSTISSLAYQEFNGQGRQFRLSMAHALRYQQYTGKRIMKWVYIDTIILEPFGCRKEVERLIGNQSGSISLLGGRTPIASRCMSS